jgi:hypothetical protein
VDIPGSQDVAYVLLVLVAADGLGVALVPDRDAQQNVDFVALAEKIRDIGGDTDKTTTGQGLGGLVVATVDGAAVAPLVAVVLGMTTGNVGKGVRNREGSESCNDESLEHFEAGLRVFNIKSLKTKRILEILECER